MNITLKSLDDKLNSLISEYDIIYDKAFKLFNDQNEVLTKSIELDKKLDKFLSKIPEQFVPEKVFDKRNIEKFIAVLKKYGDEEIFSLNDYEISLVDKLLLQTDQNLHNLFRTLCEEQIPKRPNILRSIKCIHKHSLNYYFKQDLLMQFFSENFIETIKMRIKSYYEKYSNVS